MDIKSLVNEDFFEKVKTKTVLVLGDLMVDEYIIGSVSRISPEAPVPVINFKEVKRVAGGASNVANNIRTLGCNTYLSGIADYDEAGKWLREELNNNKVSTEGIVDGERPTIIKTRFMTKGQQLLRVDKENTEEISEVAENKILDFLYSKKDSIDAVVLSDYKKGVLNSPDFVKRIIKFCNEENILVSIDSKSRAISSFCNVDIVKPNNLELEAAVGIKIVDDDTLNRAGKIYLQESGAKCLVVTRGADGISVFVPGQERKDYSSKAVQVFDVTGAGDTVISTITVGMLCGLEIGDAVRLANYAASVVISKVGTATVTTDELLRRMHEE